jgi:hypothetical protein
MPDYPRACPRCRVLTEREGFSIDRHAPSGRKALCRQCDRKKAEAYYAAHWEEKLAEREAKRQAAGTGPRRLTHAVRRQRGPSIQK